MDFEIQRCTRHCAISGRELADGEVFYSALFAKGADVERLDYAADAWTGPPENALGWWKSRMPERDAKKPRLAPRDVLLQLFRELESVPEAQDMRYVLSLLLVRRRVLRVETEQRNAEGFEVITLYCSADETTHEVTAVVPDEERIDQIQDELARLLYADAA